MVRNGCSMFVEARGFVFIALTAVLLLSGTFDTVQAETPSNTCARERTECLRARVQKGMLGSEYVPPDDTARCQAAYRACLSGQQNVLPTPPSTPTKGNVLAGVHKFRLGPQKSEQAWEINDGVASSRAEISGTDDHVVYTARGQVSANRIEGTMTWLHNVNGVNCRTVIRDTSPFVLVFNADTVTGNMRAGSREVLSQSCKSNLAKTSTTEGGNWTFPWQKIE
jgi:hypothetical protein